MSVSFIKMKLSQVVNKSGFYVLLVALICANIWEPNQAFFWSGIWYALIILNRRTEITKSLAEQAVFDSNTPQIVEDIISQCFNDYLVLNVGFKEEKEYIREEDEKKIVLYLIENVLTRMSAPLLQKIKAYYNEELLEEVLSNKIYMFVMNYAIQNNAIEESKNLELESAKKKQMVDIVL